MSIKDKIRTIPDFPKKGIMFRDLTTLFGDAEGFSESVDDFVGRYRDYDVDVVVGLEARGFILGGAVALGLKRGFVPVRKKGKLPGETESYQYELEYGTDIIEIHRDAIRPGDKVLIIDDLLATGGTAMASAELVKKLGGEVVEMAFIVNLPDIGGSRRLAEAGYSLYWQCEFEGD